MSGNVRDRIKNYIIARMLHGDERGLQYDTDLLDAGVLDSFAALELVMFLQEEFSATIELNQITAANLRSINALGNLVEDGPAARM
jgi:acyl carrier protein